MAKEKTHIETQSEIRKSDVYLVNAIKAEAKSLIEDFEKDLHDRLSSDMFKSTYQSIDDILITKYNLRNIDRIETPNYADKTEFITKGVRGNVQKANGNILTYNEAESIILDATEEELP
jgi:hypothetical protein